MIKIKRLKKSFVYAVRGLLKVIKEEQNLRIQLAFAVLAIVLGIITKISRFEWISLFLVILCVILAETINSAIERIADVLKPRIDKYVKEIKDIMAAAVMLASICALIVGLLIFVPGLMRLLNT